MFNLDPLQNLVDLNNLKVLPRLKTVAERRILVQTLSVDVVPCEVGIFVLLNSSCNWKLTCSIHRWCCLV